ncbi:MAG: DEAD/DEAH box helicase, partial [Candidatus Eremiobacteraeota bacterium]|nr:DEAD/DEAH box helicase [Candidatus Eremiobacteraeota bacterium]
MIEPRSLERSIIISTFKELGLKPALLRAVEALGFAEPTPVQFLSIPPALEGRDILASAETGSGKSAAFGLPILQHLMDEPRGKTRVLILAPTRELAEQ